MGLSAQPTVNDSERVPSDEVRFTPHLKTHLPWR